MNIPNIITLIRLILALITFGLLLHTNNYWLCLYLTIFVIVGDYLDGLAARKLNQSTKLGAWLDIASDRFIEFGYWTVFIALKILSPWVLLIYLLRGIFVDGIRAIANSQGYTAFSTESMMQSPIAKFIVEGRFIRFSYAVLKLVTFVLLIFVLIYPADTMLKNSTDICIWLSVFICLARGIPVITDGLRFLQEN